jgi:hypothetical protein
MSPPVPGQAALRPRCGRIKDARIYSGFCRSKLYELAAAHPGLFLKDGGR